MKNKAEIDVFLEPFCFFDDPEDVGNLIGEYKSVYMITVFNPLANRMYSKY